MYHVLQYIYMYMYILGSGIDVRGRERRVGREST